jgi:hypothetical protein
MRVLCCFIVAATVALSAPDNTVPSKFTTAEEALSLRSKNHEIRPRRNLGDGCEDYIEMKACGDWCIPKRGDCCDYSTGEYCDSNYECQGGCSGSTLSDGGGRRALQACYTCSLEASDRGVGQGVHDIAHGVVCGVFGC